MPESRPPGVLAALWRFRWSSLAIVVGVIVPEHGRRSLRRPAGTGHRLDRPQDARRPRASWPRASRAMRPWRRYTAQRARFVTSDRCWRPWRPISGVTTSPPSATRSPPRRRPPPTRSRSPPRPPRRDEAVELAAAVVDAVGPQTAAQIDALTAGGGGVDRPGHRRGAGEPWARIASSETLTAVGTTISELQLEKSQIQRSSALLDNGIEFVGRPPGRGRDRGRAADPRGHARAGPRPDPGRHGGLAAGRPGAGHHHGARCRADPRRAAARSAARRHPTSPLPESVALRTLPSHDYRVVWSALLRRAAGRCAAGQLAQRAAARHGVAQPGRRPRHGRTCRCCSSTPTSSGARCQRRLSCTSRRAASASCSRGAATTRSS